MILVLNFITGELLDITELNGASVDYLHYKTVITQV